MSKFLIHIHSGPERANSVTLACLVALAAHEEGHEVAMFFAADGVHLLAPDFVASVEGEGTGTMADHMTALRDAGLEVYVSGKSAKARGYDDSLLETLNASFAMPQKLVALAADADSVLSY